MENFDLVSIVQDIHSGHQSTLYPLSGIESRRRAPGDGDEIRGGSHTALHL